MNDWDSSSPRLRQVETLGDWNMFMRQRRQGNESLTTVVCITEYRVSTAQVVKTPSGEDVSGLKYIHDTA